MRLKGLDLRYVNKVPVTTMTSSRTALLRLGALCDGRHIFQSNLQSSLLQAVEGELCSGLQCIVNRDI